MWSFLSAHKSTQMLFSSQIFMVQSKWARVPFLVSLLMASMVVNSQEILNALETCDCPEGTVSQKCRYEQFLDSIAALEAAILSYDDSFVRQNYAHSTSAGAKQLSTYDCVALADSIASLNVQLINAMGCSDVESCNYNPASTSEDNCEYATNWYWDADGDGLGRSDSTQVACEAPTSSFVSDSTDNCDNPEAYNYDDEGNAACILPPDPEALDASGLDGATANINGSVENPSSLPITAAGFYFNTDPAMPEGTNTDYPATLTDGELSVDLSGLTIGTTYYYKVYVTTSYGTVVSAIHQFVAAEGPCGGLTQVTDYDGNTYSLVEVADQCWTGENLKTTHWNDGTLIPQLFLPTPRDQNNPYRVVFNDDPDTYLNIHGYGYNYWVVYPTTTGEKSLCPSGFNVPTKAAWDSIIDYAENLSESTAALQELMSPTTWNGESPGTGLNLTAIGVRQTNGTGGFGTDPFDFGTIVPTNEQVRTEYATSTESTGTIWINNDTGNGTTPPLKEFFAESNVPAGTYYKSTTSNFGTDTFVAVRCVKTSTDPGVE